MSDACDTDIVIVGAGVAGAALACALRDSGLTITLLEKSAAPADTARGDHLQPRTCEILDRWNVLDALFDAGAGRRTAATWHAGDGSVLLHSDVASLDVPHPYFAYLNHERIVETLRATAIDSGNVRWIAPLRNWWLDEQSDENAVLRAVTADGNETTLRARMLVGADGRASRVRRLLAFDASTTSYRRPIGVLFAASSTLETPEELHVYLGDSCIVSLIPRTDGGCKIGVPLGPGDVALWRQADDGELRTRLGELVPAVTFGDLRFADAYPPVQLHARKWTLGNAVLVGDACHAMHPARSQGMNIAIRCVDALADIVRSRWSGARVPALLTDYESLVRPGIDALLDENHRRGLEMDSDSTATIAGLAAGLRAIQHDPDALRAYAMRAAGYARNERFE
ncbi:MAG: NAD(P)/FAD-dependent oxidoreductase [Woeseiaceae bacterium]|nr:NAD(P)/FAD-dependent oxidoreductase [Woeseiaceae bacterium]